MSDPIIINRRDEDPAPEAPLRTGEDPDIAVEPQPEPDQRRAGMEPPTTGSRSRIDPFDRGSRSDLA